jgi:hypothetical protein
MFSNYEAGTETTSRPEIVNGSRRLTRGSAGSAPKATGRISAFRNTDLKVSAFAPGPISMLDTGQSWTPAGARWRLGADGHDLARTDLAHCQKYAGNMWIEICNPVGAGAYDHDTEWQNPYVLLEFKIAIERYKYFAYVACAPQ